MTNQDYIPIKVQSEEYWSPDHIISPTEEITQSKCLILSFLSLDKQI